MDAGDGTGTGAGGGMENEAATEPMCSVCGRMPSAEEAATARLTWSRGTQGGRASWVCAQCSRDHVRSIEGKLDQSWW
ncbi:MAG TPA: hypothetical protein VFJ94_13945 [Intrasporangium sp.]|uniref:hypothetical protein n=1 Tax=Intrasporangium sp. TaxID=1925024 RepID=UPI002D78D92C|nr:hypothetical protein [Intrasporangium sp.]HET7399615.1 hypothetical protein [Intrasporangium sp.]